MQLKFAKRGELKCSHEKKIYEMMDVVINQMVKNPFTKKYQTCPPFFLAY